MFGAVLFAVQTHNTFLGIFNDGLFIFTHPDDIAAARIHTYPAAVT